ncbi:DUF4134 domain-containing protein [Mucilaginibacter limnophilus]|uniref:DUF4134 domain-containing protein n=1 Tax=Mucilaginibacter limnophilus TaxID=1932778 RepID=A0A3S2UMP4_9SPHI|nr:DUF4134 family protein [Mucilaginibacter limnophilus]RVT99723.1 DUF4134 domain-containing protein [Mucilaginibacter limnophilus]
MIVFIILVQPGLSEMAQVRSDLSRSFFSAVSCAYILAAIFGILSALRIYHNWQMGRERITSDVAAWFYASLFMVLAGTFIRFLYGL